MLLFLGSPRKSLEDLGADEGLQRFSMIRHSRRNPIPIISQHPKLRQVSGRSLKTLFILLSSQLSAILSKGCACQHTVSLCYVTLELFYEGIFLLVLYMSASNCFLLSKVIRWLPDTATGRLKRTKSEPVVVLQRLSRASGTSQLKVLF